MTYQRPAYEEVTIAHDGNTVTLRPSLRAAATLEQRHGFPALFTALVDLNLTIIADIIMTASSDRREATAFLSPYPGKPLSPFFVAVRQPLDRLVSMFMPASFASSEKAPAGKGDPMPWAEAYGRLYDNATGWLGWTPEAAWNATPSEIARAMSAHLDRLVTTGVIVRDKQKSTSMRKNETRPNPDQTANNAAEGLDPEFDREGLRALKMKIAGGGA
jgi:hypothetical protein